MPTIKTSWLLLAGVVVPIVFSEPARQQQAATMAPVVDMRRQEQLSRRVPDALADEAKFGSSIALKRAQNLCIIVVSAETGHANVLGEGGQVIDAISNNPLPDGTFVCTTKGSTAVMQGGVAADVFNVVPADFKEYNELIDAQLAQQELEVSSR
jgi:hypothetical protein